MIDVYTKPFCIDADLVMESCLYFNMCVDAFRCIIINRLLFGANQSAPPYKAGDPLGSGYVGTSQVPSFNYEHAQ
jgi:hypothetical protein